MIWTSILLAAAVAVPVVQGNGRTVSPDVQMALRFGAETKVVFHIVDEDGNSIKDASVEASFYLHDRKEGVVRGLTDAAGCFTAAQRSVGEVNYGIKKEGFYRTKGRIELAGDRNRRGEVKNGQWQPYGKTYDVVLKRIRSPVAMVGAPTGNRVVIPMTNVVMGFDFEKNDFIRPYGRGKTSDFTMEFRTDGMRGIRNKGNELIVRGVRPFDGFYVREKDLESELRSTHVADTNANYQTEITLSTGVDEKGEWFERTVDARRYMVLRTRSQVDEKGRLVSAHYAKIYGKLGFRPSPRGGGTLTIYYLFNPVANDIRIEADPTKGICAEGARDTIPVP